MATKSTKSKPAVSPERMEEIRASARSGTNWAAEVGYGPACTCGMKPDAGHASVLGVKVERGVCYRHGR